MNTVKCHGKHITPSKIVCVGRNYVEHIEELNNEVPQSMVLFCKPNSAITEQLIAHRDEPIHYELELCFIFDGKRFSAAGLGLDLTKRAMQSELKTKGLPWERAKAFDGSALFSEFFEIADSSARFTFELSIDNEPQQQGDVGKMIYQPNDILREIQSFMSLSAGDVVMTGTPKGVGALVSGAHYHSRLMLDDKMLCQWQLQAS
ncbi:fumarylacetoacetate hydrolase family protein [Shewanella waksmanii]|uniref:fumarylacetoacetate hydrolase family protein n=1 Tax=Shewanella waksmanii TaxID=213783 RepID=UPI00373634A2